MVVLRHSTIQAPSLSLPGLSQSKGHLQVCRHEWKNWETHYHLLILLALFFSFQIFWCFRLSCFVFSLNLWPPFYLCLLIFLAFLCRHLILTSPWFPMQLKWPLDHDLKKLHRLLVRCAATNLGGSCSGQSASPLLSTICWTNSSFFKFGFMPPALSMSAVLLSL